MYIPVGTVISGNSEAYKYSLGRSRINEMEKEYSKIIWNKVMKKLIDKGYLVFDCTPNNIEFDNIGQSLNYVVKKANSCNSSLHLTFNYSYENSDIVELWVNNNGTRAENLANKICIQLNKKCINNSVVRVDKLYITNYTDMPCILIRFGYLGAPDEFINVGSEELSSCIVKGIIEDNTNI